MPDSVPQPDAVGGRHSPETAVLIVPGHHFFTAVATLPAGAPEREFAGLAALAIEAESPFAEEQLARGFFAMAAAGGLVAFAALRRKVATEPETWARAAFVVPDFATWLPRAEVRPGIVILETPEAVTALAFGAGSALPQRIVSRPVPAEPAGEAGVAAAREQALARLESAGRPMRRFRLAAVPCTPKGARYQFHWELQDGPAGQGTAHPVTLTTAQLWAMDLREPEFLRTKRRDFRWNRLAWGTLLGLGVAAGVLLAAEAGLIGARLLLARREARIAAQVPAARLSETNSDIVDRLAGYIDRKPQPLELLAYINDLRPRSIYFTKVSMEGGLQVVIEGATTALTDINEFEAALKRAPAFGSVEVRNIRAREGGGTFQLSLSFRAGFSAAAAAPATPAATPTPANTAVPVVAGPAPEAGARTAHRSRAHEAGARRGPPPGAAPKTGTGTENEPPPGAPPDNSDAPPPPP